GLFRQVGAWSGIHWRGFPYPGGPRLLSHLPAHPALAGLAVPALRGPNYPRPTKVGGLALYGALAAVAPTPGIRLARPPALGSARLAGPIDPEAFGSPGRFAREAWKSWVGFTEIVLALSGVEAVANMTGIMVTPVERTARRTILPVLIEIVILNLVLAAA